MTDPVVVVSGVKDMGKKSSQGKQLKKDTLKHHQDCAEDDSVDISQEAHDRASGKKHKNILEYLEEEGV